MSFVLPVRLWMSESVAAAAVAAAVSLWVCESLCLLVFVSDCGPASESVSLFLCCVCACLPMLCLHMSEASGGDGG